MAGALSELTQGFTNQLRVIGALTMREVTTRFGRENLGFAWIVGEPILFTGAVIILWSAIKSPYEHGIALVPFLLTGYMPLVLFRHCVSRSIFCVRANAGLLYHRKVKLIDMFAARMILEIGGSYAAFALAYLVFTVAGVLELPHDLGLVYLGWLYMTWFSVALAMIIGALSEVSELVEKLWGPTSYIMVPLSGCFYMASWLPDQWREVALLLPMPHAFEMLRAGYFGPAVTTYWDPIYPAYCNAFLTLVGLYTMERVRPYIEIE